MRKGKEGAGKEQRVPGIDDVKIVKEQMHHIGEEDHGCRQHGKEKRGVRQCHVVGMAKEEQDCLPGKRCRNREQGEDDKHVDQIKGRVAPFTEGGQKHDNKVVHRCGNGGQQIKNIHLIHYLPQFSLVSLSCK